MGLLHNECAFWVEAENVFIYCHREKKNLNCTNTAFDTMQSIGWRGKEKEAKTEII